jgi:nitroimidazol reductase NimA-like FMN-containing flavoprotein (pyridoxamine 5'-phosphate oxidase superfamily)
MRRAEKEISDPAEVMALLKRASVLHLAMVDWEGWPYVIPVCFGVSGDTIFVHSAREGKKIDAIDSNHRVCFSAALDAEIRRGEVACGWTMAFRSVVGFGDAMVLTGDMEKRRALDVIMGHYGGDGPWDYPDAALEKTAVIQIRILSMTGKTGGY